MTAKTCILFTCRRHIVAVNHLELQIASIEAAVRFIILLVSFLFMFQLSNPSLLSLTPHEFCHFQTKQEGEPCSLSVHEQAGVPLYGVLCPDWIKCAGLPENSYYL